MLIEHIKIREIENFNSAVFPENRYKSYQIVFELHSDRSIAVGKLGRFKFPAGTYVYTGSAKRNIKSRIARHTSVYKKLKWHIDYLLSEKDVTISQIKLFRGAECKLNQETQGIIIVPGFGATDCRSNCVSHLKLLNNGHTVRSL